MGTGKARDAAPRMVAATRARLSERKKRRVSASACSRRRNESGSSSRRRSKASRQRRRTLLPPRQRRSKTTSSKRQRAATRHPGRTHRQPRRPRWSRLPSRRRRLPSRSLLPNVAKRRQLAEARDSTPAVRFVARRRRSPRQRATPSHGRATPSLNGPCKTLSASWRLASRLGHRGQGQRSTCPWGPSLRAARRPAKKLNAHDHTLSRFARRSLTQAAAARRALPPGKTLPASTVSLTPPPATASRRAAETAATASWPTTSRLATFWHPWLTQYTASPSCRVCTGRTVRASASWPRTATRWHSSLVSKALVAMKTSVVFVLDAGAGVCGGGTRSGHSSAAKVCRSA
mmetsp:Transcript_2593/g.8268  ORF Transcript_2593/g.8268 Transcript_2593/m.8268 type:complete len:346 (+) Transcript_2593:152-1189(+)